MIIKNQQRHTFFRGKPLILKTINKSSALAVIYALMMPVPVWAQSSSNTSITVDCTEVTVDYQSDENLTVEEQIQRMDDALDQSLSQYDGCQQGMSGGGGDDDETLPGEGVEGEGVEGEGEGEGEENADNEGEGDGQDKTDSATDDQGNGKSETEKTEKTAKNGKSEPSNSMSGGAGKSITSKQKKARLGAFDAWVKKNSQSSRSSGIQGTEPIDPSVWKNAEKDNNPTSGGYGAPQNREKSDAMPGQIQPPLNGKAPPDIPASDSDSVLEQQIRKAAENEPDPVKRQQLWNEYRRYKGLPPVKVDSGT